ncbi:MAG: GNAT family N-acetyltransferase [Planctomycetota bacterium]
MKPLPDGDVTTPRLRLRRLAQGDRQAFQQIVTSAEATRFTGGTMQPQQADLRFNELLRGASGKLPAVRAVQLIATGETIGHCGLFEGAGETSCELGIFLLPQHWSQGYATEVARALIDVALSVCGLESVRASVDSDHAASRRVLEKAGMTISHWERDEAGAYPVYEIARASLPD